MASYIPGYGKLKVTTFFKDIPATDLIKAFAEKRAQKISKYLHNQGVCNITFKQAKNGFSCEMHLVSGDFEAKASASSDNFYTAIDEVTQKTLNQCVKHKEKQMSFRRQLRKAA